MIFKKIHGKGKNWQSKCWNRRPNICSDELGCTRTAFLRLRSKILMSGSVIYGTVCGKETGN